MTESDRPIDQAMSNTRPAKDTIRRLWVEQANERSAEAKKLDIPLYFTLPGAAGLDVQALIDEELVRLNESGGIHDDDTNLIVALESDMRAYGQLKSRFPGLAVQNLRVEELLGKHPDWYPTAKIKKLCRAAVVNLDFNGPLKVADDGSIKSIMLVEKFARMHEGNVDRLVAPWALCITYRALIAGDPTRVHDQQAFLLDQVSHSEELKATIEAAAPWLLEADYDLSAENDEIRLQRSLGCLVPALIIRAVGHHGWRVTAAHIVRYGHDAQTTAAMVSFVFNMSWDEATVAQSNAAARQDHGTLLDAMVIVDADGSTKAGP